MAEKKSQLKAKLESELGAVTEAGAIEDLRAAFNKEERAVEHECDHTMHTFAISLSLEYNFLSLGAAK
jgi:hypothetical protein